METDITEHVRSAIRGIIARIREHRGGFVPVDEVTIALDSVMPRPVRIAVLADKWCASICDVRLFARQSDKVTVFGENTGGFLDFGDVRVPREILYWVDWVRGQLP